MHKEKDRKTHLKDLVEGCIRHDLDSWDQFINAVSPLIIYVIREKFDRLGFYFQRSDIENIKQDIFLSIWRDNRLETIKDREKVVPWICAFSMNTVSNYIRRLKPDDLPNTSLLDDSLKSPAAIPLDEIANKEMRHDMDSAFNSLNAKEKIVIKLLLVYEKSYREIAEIMNIPLGTALVCSQRAKVKLRKKLKKYVIK